MLTDVAQERWEQGRAARKQVPRSSHGDWSPAADRPDPLKILTDQDEGRLQFLVPVRHARMAESPFAFYRGAAAVMAADLAGTPTIGSQVQLCGDAHLSNFGTFASAERLQVFDVNDFDETLPGPWEWDVKRFAASLLLAGRDNGYDDDTSTGVVRDGISAYRQAMATFADQSALAVWYAQLSMADVRSTIPDDSTREQFDKTVAKARGKNSRRALGKLTEEVDGQLQFRSDPPLMIRLSELVNQLDVDAIKADMSDTTARYLETLRYDRRRILARFNVVDAALKVVGVGSVGTRCWLVLLIGRDHGEPLILQLKEATASVLEPYLGASTAEHHGERVVTGQRMMQASSDIFLGWSESNLGPHYYVRQYHDMKGSAEVAGMEPNRLSSYAQVCGWTLAHAHARSGDEVSIGGYLGKGTVFDEAMVRFAQAYADQNQADYEAFKQAIADGRLAASE